MMSVSINRALTEVVLLRCLTPLMINRARRLSLDASYTLTKVAPFLYLLCVNQDCLSKSFCWKYVDHLHGVVVDTYCEFTTCMCVGVIINRCEWNINLGGSWKEKNAHLP